MFGFGKKSTPLLHLIPALEQLYELIFQEITNYMVSDGLSLENFENGNFFKKHIEPKVFSYVILIWGIGASKLNKSEKQFVCSFLTSKLGDQLSSFSENDGANYLRYGFIEYGKEAENGSNDQFTRRITFKFMLDMEVNIINHMATFGAISINLKELINLPADYIDEQLKKYKFI